MPVNPSVNQTVQLGIQPDFATAVAATKRLRSFMVNLDPNIETDAFTPNGNIFPSSNDLIQEWTEAEIEGVLTFTEIVYLLTLAFGPAVITTPTDAVLTRQWKWTLRGNTLLSPSYGSVEKGNSVYALRAAAMACTGLNIGYSRKDRIEIGGSMYGKPVELGHTMTTIASNPTVELVRVLPQMLDWYAEDAWADLDDMAGNQIMQAYEADLSLDNLFGSVWPMRSDLNGHDSLVPTAIDSESSLLMEANAAGMAFLTTTRNSQTKYLRGLATGPIIETEALTDFHYKFQVDQTVQIKDISAFEDADGPYAVPVTFQPIDDGTNPVVEFTIWNALTAL